MSPSIAWHTSTHPQVAMSIHIYISVHARSFPADPWQTGTPAICDESHLFLACALISQRTHRKPRVCVFSGTRTLPKIGSGPLSRAPGPQQGGSLQASSPYGECNSCSLLCSLPFAAFPYSADCAVVLCRPFSDERALRLYRRRRPGRPLHPPGLQRGSGKCLALRVPAHPRAVRRPVSVQQLFLSLPLAVFPQC